jgi:hypothetical protein
VAIEILLVDDIRNIIPGPVIQHQPPDNRLFRFHRMRRDLEVIDALAQFSNAGGYFRHITASGRSASVGNDKPFLAAQKRKRLVKQQPSPK